MCDWRGSSVAADLTEGDAEDDALQTAMSAELDDAEEVDSP